MISPVDIQVGVDTKEEYLLIGTIESNRSLCDPQQGSDDLQDDPSDVQQGLCDVQEGSHDPQQYQDK